MASFRVTTADIQDEELALEEEEKRMLQSFEERKKQLHMKKLRKKINEIKEKIKTLPELEAQLNELKSSSSSLSGEMKTDVSAPTATPTATPTAAPTAALTKDDAPQAVEEENGVDENAAGETKSETKSETKTEGPAAPTLAPPTPVVIVPPTPVVVVPPTPVNVDPSQIHYVKSGANLRKEYIKMIAAGKTCMVLGEGEYRLEEKDLEDGKYLVLKKPTKIYGQGCEKTTLIGIGLKIQGKKSDGIVEINNFMIQRGKEHGLVVERGMNVRMRGCMIVECERRGLFVDGADISCDNLQVIGCGWDGVCVNGNATIMLSGESTSVQENVTKGDSDCYGLKAFSLSSKIQLVAPLTRHQISFKNGGGGNWGGGGTIEQVV